MRRSVLEEMAGRLERELRKDSHLREIGVRVHVGKSGRDELDIVTRGEARYHVCARTWRDDMPELATTARQMIAREERVQAALAAQGAA